MPITPQTKNICGHEYTVIPFNCRRSLSLQRRLLPVIGPALGGLMEMAPALGKQGLDSQIPPGVLSSVFSKVGEAFGNCDAETLIPELLAGTTRDHADLSVERHFDDAFRGNMGEMYQAVWYVMTVNDFFALSAITKGGNLAGLLQKFQAQGSESSVTS